MQLPSKQRFRITSKVKQEIIKIIDERINEVHVTKEDFTELKNIVKELARSQCELAKAQKRTEERVEELAKAQKNTELEIKKLAEELKETRKELGGLSRSISYGLENEAYRMIPKILKERYGIELTEKLIRTEIGDKEINLFGKGRQNGKELFIVGEVKLKIEERLEELKRKRGELDTFEELEEKVWAVKSEYKTDNVVKLLIAHYADKKFLNKAKDKQVIVIQSFEW